MNDFLSAATLIRLGLVRDLLMHEAATAAPELQNPIAKMLRLIDETKQINERVLLNRKNQCKVDMLSKLTGEEYDG